MLIRNPNSNCEPEVNNQISIDDENINIHDSETDDQDDDDQSATSSEDHHQSKF